MLKCGLSVAPADAHQLVIDNANVITTSIGGAGVVREFSDLLLLDRCHSLTEVYNVLLEKIIADDVQKMEQ